MSGGDFVQRFLFEGLDIRGALVRLTDGWQSMLRGRSYGPVLSRLFGEMTVVTLMIGGQLKQPGRLTAQVRGNGALGLLVVDCDERLRLRGMATGAHDLADAPLPALLGDGQLVVTVQTDASPTPYQSVVPLEGATVTEVFERFLEQSEQQPTALWLSADESVACGLFLQKLPGADQRDADGWARICHLAATLTPAEMKTLDTGSLLMRLFHEDIAAGGIRVFDPVEPRHHCPRDEEKVRRLVLSLGRAEVESILAEKGEVLIHDDMCNHDYRFDAGDIARLFGDPPPAVH
ncbi:Hsp33 family molecular chaperone HslO [Methyloversatilis thermotolerans]|uniref:Hsp33 family molecular chaperone HslO n=1 Tax=Methyloversatilis thermotolerans TaxID=1346290 RepID=UPI00036062CE|nr:Hsp33 family molecular chaperone HslO [Methyloversatilis thermotolerans]